MKDADWTPIADAGAAWRRAACAVHAEQRRLHQLITEVYRLADAVVVRMQLMGYARTRDGVLPRVVALRDRLTAEAQRPPLLRAWQRTFDELERVELDPGLEALLDEDLQEQGLPEAPSHQLHLRFATAPPRDCGGGRDVETSSRASPLPHLPSPPGQRKERA
jgi:hypothetical protein